MSSILILLLTALTIWAARTYTESWESAFFWGVCCLFSGLQVTSMLLLFCGLLSTVSAVLTIVLAISSALWVLSSRPRAHLRASPALLFWCVFGGLYGVLAWPAPWYRDSLTYHLSLAKHYSNTGGYGPTDEVIFAYFPQGWQSILALFHASGNGYEFNPRFIAVLLTLASAAGLIAVAKKHSNRLAYCGGAMFLLIPTVLEFGASCYVQAWLTLLSLAWAQALSRRWQYRAAILLGLMLSVKYSALFWLIPSAIIWVKTKNWKLPAVTAVVGCPWYLHNLIQKGNPLFPLAYDLFGGTGWDTERAKAYAITLENYGLGRDWVDFLLLPWRLFTTMNLDQGFQGSVGPALGLLMILAIWRQRSINSTIWLGLCWMLLWGLQVHQIRFAIPGIAVLLLGTLKLGPRKWPMLLCGSVAALWALYPLNQLWERQARAFELLSDHSNTQDTEAHFLRHQLPENYLIYQTLNEQAEVKKVWLVWMRGYHYYLNKPARIDSVFGAHRFEELLFSTETEILTQLNQAQITHIAINHRFFLIDGNADQWGEGATNRLRETFDKLLKGGLLQPRATHRDVVVYEVKQL